MMYVWICVGFWQYQGDHYKACSAPSLAKVTGPHFTLVGSGGVPGAMFSVSPASHGSSPEPDGAEYATPILDQPRHTPVNTSKFQFTGENGM